MFAETSHCSGQEVYIILHTILERTCMDLDVEILVAKSVIQARKDGKTGYVCL